MPDIEEKHQNAITKNFILLNIPETHISEIYLHPARTFGSPPNGKNSRPLEVTKCWKLECVANLTRCPFS
jgi:hypothetical protein